MTKWTTPRIARILLLLLIAASVVVAIVGKGGALQERNEIDAPPSIGHPAGTDVLGRDRLQRNAQALLLCVSLATSAAVLATALAAAVALASAYASPALSTVILLLSDSLLAVPGLFLLMMVRASLPLGLSAARMATLTFLLIAILGWPLMVRTIAAEIRRHRASSWMLYCHATGLQQRDLFGRHMLAHLRPLLLAHVLLTIPAFLVAEANLGVLGLGVPDPLASWGGMLDELAQSSLRGGSAWRYMPPALLITVLVLLEFASVTASCRGEMTVAAEDTTHDMGERFETASP